MNRSCATCGAPFLVKGKDRYCSDVCRCGTDAGYNRGCGCDRCKRAHARNHKRLRCIPNPTVSALGTRRRVQALACLGWSTAELSRRLGRHRSYLLKVLRNDRLEPATVLTICRLYDELSMTLCTSPTAAQTADDARRRGWVPPLAWDDATIDDPAAEPVGVGLTGARARRRIDPMGPLDLLTVERILGGDWRAPASKATRCEVLRRWDALGRARNELARLTGWKPERYDVPSPHDDQEVA